MSEKRRAPNFLPAEKNCLLKLITKHQNILENKESDAVNIKMKNAVWEQITNEFNSQGRTVYRDVKSLKSLWDNLKRGTRKHFAKIKKQVHLTGGGQAVTMISGKEALLFEHVKPIIEASVTSLPSPFDGDYIPEIDDNAYALLLNSSSNDTEVITCELSEVLNGNNQSACAQKNTVDLLSCSSKSEDPATISLASATTSRESTSLNPKTAECLQHKKQEITQKAKSLSKKEINSVLYKSRNKNDAGKMKNAERAQSFVDLATAKREFIALQKDSLKEKTQLEIAVLKAQLEKENLQVQLLKKQLMDN